jgi:hypothetical protein
MACAVSGVVRSPSQFANRDAYIHDFRTNQREILAVAEAEISPGGIKFEEATVDVDGVGKSQEALKRGESSPQTVFGTIRYAVWCEGATGWDENDDSEALGLKKKDLHVEIKKKIEEGV